MRKHTFKQGASEWVVVRTNGFNDWDDAVDVDFPEYLTVVERLPLTNGRLSFYVQCSAEVSVGTKGRIEAALDRTRVGLPALEENAVFTVIRGTAAMPKPSRPKTTLPDIEQIPVEPGDQNWEYMHSGDLPFDRVAFNVIDDRNKVRLLWNKKFFAFASASDEIERRFRSVPMTKKFVTDYTTYLVILTLAGLDAERSTTEVGDGMALIHRMRAEAVTANAMMLTLLMGKDSGDELELAV